MGIEETDLFKVEMQNGLTLEEMESQYFDADALRNSPRRVYRVGGTSKRIYYTLNDNGEPFFYSSVTTAISRNMPTSPFLIKWIADKGFEEAENYKEERADYGTFLHIEISDLLINRKCDLDSLEDRLKQYIFENNLPQSFIYYSEELRKDILAFAQWVIDYNVKVIAVELVLADEETGMGGAIDIVCELDQVEKGFFGEVLKSGPNKGQPKETKRTKRVKAIVDNKSGRKGFFENHKIQLQIYRKIWNVNFPEIQIENVFNWSPKDWTGSTPTYNFANQTSIESEKIADLVIEMERVRREKDKNGVLVVHGEINLDGPGLEENYYNVELSEFITGKHNEK